VTGPARNAAPAPPAGVAPRTSVVTPVRVLSVVAVLIALFIIFAPQPRADAGSMYSSYAAGAGGARALYDVLGRLGFATSRNEKTLTAAPPDTTAAYVLVKPAQPLTAVEQAQLLASVRGGAILIFTADNDDLTDSLGFEPAPPADGFHTLHRTTVAGGNPPAPTATDARAVFQAAFPIAVTVASKSKSGNQAFLWLDPPPFGRSAQLDSAQQPTLVLGHRVGRGYAIAIAPAPIVMNQVMRDPRTAIAIVRALQFANTATAAQPRSNMVVFDEYHHGFGTHADMVAAVRDALTGTPVGRVTLGLVGAALVLLLASGVRPLAPVSVPPVSRRSPLEHVGALAHAYAQVDARSLGASRLVRGLRRRHSLGLPRTLPDDTYLSALRTRIPTAAADVDRIAAALAPHSSDPSDRFSATGAAVANIERAFRE
jgi:hypothetical protein